MTTLHVTPPKKIDPRPLLGKLLRYWYLFALFLAGALIGARLYLRYATPAYQVISTLLIIGEEGGTLTGEEMILEDLGFRSRNEVENEMAVLKSRTLMQEVVKALNLQVQYSVEGRVRVADLYKFGPLWVDSFDLARPAFDRTFSLSVLDTETFAFSDGEMVDTMRFDQWSSNTYGSFLVRYQPRYATARKEVDVRFASLEQVAQSFANRLVVRNAYNTNVLNLILEETVPERGIDLLNRLAQEYNRQSIAEKNRVKENTLAFINERLLLLTEELTTVEKGLESYKQANAIAPTIESNAELFIDELTSLEKELTNLDIQYHILESLEAYLASRQGAERYQLLPAGLQLQNQELNRILSGFNERLLVRERLLQSAQPSNPAVQALDRELVELQENILENIRQLLMELRNQRRQLQGKIAEIRNQIQSIPRRQRELLEIIRQQQIKENLYLFLLEKREETALTLAVTPPNSRVVDPAFCNNHPVRPNRKMIYAMAFILGLGLPLGLVFLLDLLDDKVRSEQELKTLTAAPFLGAIARTGKKEYLVVEPGSRSAIAEMFRLLRTNLHFLAPAQTHKTLLVTSAMSGDGKTFVTVNLGLSLALSGKRTLLLSFDLRKPRLGEYLTGTPAPIGITHFLVGEATLEEILQPSLRHENLFYIASGPIPPNPAELILGERTAGLFEALKTRFDYILVDCPPVGLVTDALLLSSFVDTTLFVVRHGKTRRADVQILEDIYRNRKLPQPAIILNGIRRTRGRYGYGYGYYKG